MTDNPQRSCNDMNSHNFLEIATEIVDKYWKEKPEKFPNPYLLEKDISDALSLQYQKGRKDALEEAAKTVENLPAFNGWGKQRLPEPPHYEFYIDNRGIAFSIRNLSRGNKNG